MEYRRLGKSGLKVSEITLGCGSATFAGKADEQTALRIISTALELGINCIDTAETYAEGRSEMLIGKALEGKRGHVIIATKFGKDRSVGPSEQRASRSRVMKAVEGSLKRLNTDYIDLYILHEPDPETPIEETLRALDDLVRSGKVRYIACSGFPAWKLCQALWAASAQHLETFVAASSDYNLLNREIEHELVPCCLSLGVGVVPTVPLAGGFLTGKYRRGHPMPKMARFSTSPRYANRIYQDPSRYNRLLSGPNFDKIEKLEAFATERNHSVGELAIAWLLSHPWLGTVPVGVSTAEQLMPNARAADWKLTPDELLQLDRM